MACAGVTTCTIILLPFFCAVRASKAVEASEVDLVFEEYLMNFLNGGTECRDLLRQGQGGRRSHTVVQDVNGWGLRVLNAQCWENGGGKTGVPNLQMGKIKWDNHGILT